MLMALFSAPLCSESDERAAQVLAQHLAEFDLEPILLSDDFRCAGEHWKNQFDGIIADSNDDPEATFLIERDQRDRSEP